MKKRPSENIYSSAVIRNLEQEYCCSRSAVVASSSCLVSSHGLGARLMSRVYNGGRQIVYTATVGAMLVNNMAVPLHGEVITVSAGETSNGLEASNGDSINVYGSTKFTYIYNGGRETIYDGGSSYYTRISSGGSQVVSSGGMANSTQVFSSGVQIINEGGTANNTIVSGSQVINSGGVANSTTISGGMTYTGIQII